METWLIALLGGALIGVSATVLLLLTGRIAGVSGIVLGLLQRSDASEWSWRIAFLLGLMVAGAIGMQWLGQSTPSPASLPVLIVAGLLVGYGTSLGSGCTSGHGVCGLGRLSKRSLWAVLVFMASGIATVYIARHVLGAGA